MTSATSSFRARDAALLVLLSLLWGNSFLFIKLAVAAIAPLWIVAGRMTIGGVLLLVIVAALRQRVPRDAPTIAVVAFIGIVGSALPWVGQAWAQQFLDSGLLAVLNSCTPVATLVMAVLAGQEKMYRNRVVGLALAIVGTLIVIGGEIGSGRSIVALLVAVLATTGYGFASVATRARVSGRIASIPAAAIQLCGGALVLGPIAWTVEGPFRVPESPVPALSLLALGLLGTGIAFIIYMTLIQNVGATNTSMVTYLVPIVGLSSGTVIRGERFGVNVFAGALALICGVWLSQRQPGA